MILQRQNALTGNEWHRIDSGVVEAGGGYSIPHTFLVPGDANLRVLVLSQGRNVPETSSPLTYEISQAQNKELTIEATPDPILYGQSVVIGGMLAGVTTSQPVTLLARTLHQHGFAPVAQVSTSTNGAYTFPAQTPVNSTYYKVQGDGKSSAVLFEGVRYVLTAEASATSVMEGQVVTFSGKVAPTPSQPGHVIYLQRENASGTGFHVVRVGTVTPEATFSIPYQVFSLGTDVFRVYIPGGPDNGGAASQPFTINVSPAPAAALKETPGNSSTPSEGSTTSTEVEKEGEERGTEARTARRTKNRRRSSPRASPPPVTPHTSLVTPRPPHGRPRSLTATSLLTATSVLTVIAPPSRDRQPGRGAWTGAGEPGPAPGSRGRGAWAGAGMGAGPSLQPYAATARASRWAPTLRLTRCRALSTVLVSHARCSPTCS